MSKDSQELPYKNLGEKLKTIRQRSNESVAEVSGAVEIDEQMMRRIEQGFERPSEDILLLLINHFRMPDDDADTLWELAGYDPPDNQDDHEGHDHSHNDQSQNRTVLMIMAVDPRVIYSDGVQVTANSSGVILGFSQGSGTPNALTTAKIGMSREQAYGLLRVLHQTLEASKPKQLPSSTQKDTPPQK